jgi:hypothetical protein
MESFTFVDKKSHMIYITIFYKMLARAHMLVWREKDMEEKDMELPLSMEI